MRADANLLWQNRRDDYSSIDSLQQGRQRNSNTPGRFHYDGRNHGDDYFLIDAKFRGARRGHLRTKRVDLGRIGWYAEPASQEGRGFSV